MEEDPRPQADRVDLNKKAYTFQCYLKSISFSYRCAKHYIYKRKYLLTIPINDTNYDPQT